MSLKAGLFGRIDDYLEELIKFLLLILFDS